MNQEDLSKKRAHIQHADSTSEVLPYWGYPDRVWPCTNDPGSCEYLDVVYNSHRRGMIYVGIIWLTILLVLLGFILSRRFSPSKTHTTDEESSSERSSTLVRLKDSSQAFARTYLLPNSIEMIFGKVTRLQVTILSVFAAYLLLWSFIGISYHTWVTPVKNSSPQVYNTRSSLGPFADRVGVIAYALTPLSILLASRESIISLITGIPYHHFNFLHKWLGHIIFIQSALHTIGWCVIEARLYQPQPEVGREWIKQRYMVFGVVAMILITILWLLSFSFAIKRTGYEFFRKSHYVLAMLFIGTCWGHWSKLSCFMIPSLILWLMDRVIRLLRLALLHYNVIESGKRGFKLAQASAQLFPDSENGDVVRLDFRHPQKPWSIGQHFYLCFPEGSIWQSHPMTPLSDPESLDGKVKHSYLFRAKKGETRRVAQIIRNKIQENLSSDGNLNSITTGLILTGPYGGDLTKEIQSNNNLFFAGGSGITFVLPVIFHLIKTRPESSSNTELIWVVRKERDLNWIASELKQIRESGVLVKIFVTREPISPSPSSSSTPKNEKVSLEVEDSPDGVSSSIPHTDSISNQEKLSKFLPVEHATKNQNRHPDLDLLTKIFIDKVSYGSVTVFASGPGGMVTDLRRIVSALNDGKKVFKGDQRFNVKLCTDNRLE